MARIVFMGTPDFALPSLRLLLESQEVVAVVTQPDRPAGRKRQLRASPVKRAALEAGLPILQPARIRDANTVAALRSFNADAFVVAAYGHILPQQVLDIPRIACINVHASLLPRWRGAAPIQAAILAGDQETGATIMVMDAGLDTGPLVAQRSLTLESAETGQSLHDKLAVVGAELLGECLPDFLNGSIEPVAQDASQATYAPSIKKSEGALDWTRPAMETERKVRAFTPWPGTFTRWKDLTLKIHGGFASAGDAPPGKVVERGGQAAIGAGLGLYSPTELQLEGKKRQSISDFLNGHGDFIGSVLKK